MLTKSYSPHDSTQAAPSDMASQVAAKATDYASKAGEKLEQAYDSADATVRSVAEHGREAGERVQEVAGNMKSAIDKSVKDQPIATLAVVGVLGFVLGALWKS